MERDRIAKRECVGNLLVGRPQKKWIDTLKECLRKGGLNGRGLHGV